MTTLAQKTMRLVPAMFIMGLIFFLSHQPGDTIRIPFGLHIDKVLHALTYAILGFSYIYALGDLQKQVSKRFFDTIIILMCLTYGISDEWHQSFTPMRFPSGADIIADGFGGLVAVFFWRKWG